MNKECQAVGCTNIGHKVTVRMTIRETGKDEVHDIYMCEFHIRVQQNINLENLN